MKMTIERAIKLARVAVAERPLSVFGDTSGKQARFGEIVAARHASNLGQSDDRWILLIKIDWHGLPIVPDATLVHVDSEREEVTFRPAF